MPAAHDVFARGTHLIAPSRLRSHVPQGIGAPTDNFVGLVMALLVFIVVLAAYCGWQFYRRHRDDALRREGDAAIQRAKDAGLDAVVRLALRRRCWLTRRARAGRPV